MVLAAARPSPPIAQFLPVPRVKPTRCNLHAERGGNEGTHVRQCDPSLPSNWRDDPPQEVRALLQNLLHDALSLVVLLPHIVVALLHLHPRPRSGGLRSSKGSDQSLSFSSLHPSSNQCACQMQIVRFPQQKEHRKNK